MKPDSAGASYGLCVECWREIPSQSRLCPHCGDDYEARKKGADFIRRLIDGLELGAEISARAARILGDRAESKAVVGLCRVVRQSTHTVAVEAALEALQKIGDNRSALTIAWAVQHTNPRVRAAAARAIASGMFRDAK